MVFVTVCDENRAYPIFIFFQIRNVRDDDINPEHLIAWEHKAGIDDEDVVV